MLVSSSMRQNVDWEILGACSSFAEIAIFGDGLDTVLSEAKEGLSEFSVFLQPYNSICSESR
jgi:hypothetical protein